MPNFWPQLLDLDQFTIFVTHLNDSVAQRDKSLLNQEQASFGHAFESVEKKFHDILLHHHLSHWHPITTAACNQSLELGVIDNNKLIVLPFPCRRDNRGDWFNVDLDIRMHVEPVRWRLWQNNNVAIKQKK